MDHRISIDPGAAAPIWRQIEDGIRRVVAAGLLVPGDAVPSVRELARELIVNPATVAKAYQRLVDDGLLAVRRGEGTYVAERGAAAREAERARLLREGARRYTELAVELGVSRREAVIEVEAVWGEADGYEVEVGRG